MKQKNCILVLLGLIVISSHLSARNFRVLGLTQLKGMEVLEITSPRGSEKVPVSISSVTKEYTVPQSGEVGFYLKAPEAGEETKPLFEIRFPDSAGDFLVLLMAERFEGSPTYSHLLIEDTNASFPKGAVMIMNLMQKPIMAKLGEDRVRVESGAREMVSLVKQDQPFEDGVMFAAEFNGFGKVFSTSSWYLVPSMKIFCVIYPDRHGNPQIRRIRLT